MFAAICGLLEDAGIAAGPLSRVLAYDMIDRTQLQLNAEAKIDAHCY
jgi:hypothetical protein